MSNRLLFDAFLTSFEILPTLGHLYMRPHGVLSMTQPPEKKPKLTRKPPRKAVNVKVLEARYRHLEEFNGTHGWSVNETINQAIELLVAIKAMDSEDFSSSKALAVPTTRLSGRLLYLGRDGSTREIATLLMNDLSRP